LAQNILEAEGPWFISFISVSLFKFIAPNIAGVYQGEINFIVLGSVLLVSQLFLMVQNILLVYVFEMAIDVIKHSFISKFNNISPIAYSEFLEVLCKQVLI